MALRPAVFKHLIDALSHRWRQAMALPIFTLALGLYGFTLAPSVVTLFDDSLEFQLVTYQLGIAHPPGYPLYTLLGWLFTRLPIGLVAYRVNLMSAVFGAVTASLVYLIGLELTTASNRRDYDTRQSWTEVLAALIGALALIVSPVFWSQATVAEVYTLNAAFVAGILWLLVRRRQTEASRLSSPSGNWLLVLLFLFSLSLTHHRTTVLLLPAIAVALWRAPRDWAYRLSLPGGIPQVGAKLAAAMIAPLLLYLYIPLRGHIGSLDGAYTNTLAGFWRQVTASGYGIFIFQNPLGAERGADYYFSLFLAQFGPLGLVAGLAGLVALRRHRAWAITGIAFVTYFAFNLLYRVADIQVFFIPTFLIWAIWIGVAAGWLLTRLRSVSSSRLFWLQAPIWLAVTLLLIGQSVTLLWGNLPTLDRSKDWSVYDYGVDVVQQPMEPHAAIVGILGEVTLVRYLQTTEGRRPDLLLIAADQESQRLATVAHLLDEGRGVYLTRELPDAPTHWSLSAVGPLIRVNPQPVLEAPSTPYSAGSHLIPEIALHGYAISRPPAHSSPSPVRLSLTWQVMAPLTRELKVSVRLYQPDALADGGGRPVAQADAVPVHFAYPTTAWRPGEFIADGYDLSLPPDFQPGTYIPLIILYDPAQGAAEVGRLALPPLYLPIEGLEIKDQK